MPASSIFAKCPKCFKGFDVELKKEEAEQLQLRPLEKQLLCPKCRENFWTRVSSHGSDLKVEVI